MQIAEKVCLERHGDCISFHSYQEIVSKKKTKETFYQAGMISFLCFGGLWNAHDKVFREGFLIGGPLAHA